MNELCIFLHTSQDCRHSIPTPRIRPIYYTTRNDLLTKIGFFDNPIPLISALNPNVKEFVPAPPKAIVPAVLTEPEPAEVHQWVLRDGEPDAEPTVTIEDEVPDFVEEDEADKTLDEEPIRVSFGAATTDREVEAARVIQRHWKRHNADDRKLGNYFFTECALTLDKFKQSEQVKQKYKKYYLGPLPHVLHYLEKIRGSRGVCRAEKKEIQKRLQAMDDPDENLMKIAEISVPQSPRQLEKDLVTLRKQLLPCADLHKACSVNDLKNTARNFEVLKTRIDCLLPSQPDEVTEEYDLGWKGLLKVAIVKPKAKREKPALNTEELLDM
ncbi:hypothetical protein FRB93_008308 [Tulasnella sp. JGI-2019a]|nr:hypothetical protein FRB93_008308 [Tulasnella sp. JGI-2019a]